MSSEIACVKYPFAGRFDEEHIGFIGRMAYEIRYYLYILNDYRLTGR